MGHPAVVEQFDARVPDGSQRRPDCDLSVTVNLDDHDGTMLGQGALRSVEHLADYRSSFQLVRRR